MKEKQNNRRNRFKKKRMAKELQSIQSDNDTISLNHTYNRMFYEVTPSVLSKRSDNLKSPSKLIVTL